ncbi:hypothetical protein BTUL_0250g00120 [Botrytis tulipae]|uniref:Uncharacterized protein n=1 Tax=Botrytis tulipae TaxID=87230 RepID=A0A4Z1EED4_9HELO|nr:hypothetical protein BTUL_0250g00120 [Botrytis tulipae]
MTDDNGRRTGGLVAASKIVGKENISRDRSSKLSQESDRLNRHIITAMPVVGPIGHVLCHCKRNISNSGAECSDADACLHDDAVFCELSLRTKLPVDMSSATKLCPEMTYLTSATSQEMLCNTTQI